MFHLMTHAFFKALLFMAAGIVIHALVDEQDIRKMGGLRQLMPRVYWAFLIGSLALVGIPRSRASSRRTRSSRRRWTHGAYGYVLWVAGLAGAFLTGLYTFRMLFIVFWGEPSAFVREHFHALNRDVPGVSMASTVGVLAVLSAIGGWLQFTPCWQPVDTWLRDRRRAARDTRATGRSWSRRILAVAARSWRDRRRVADVRSAARRRAALRVRAAHARAQVLLRRALRRASSTGRPCGSRTALRAGVEGPLIAETGRDLGDETRDLGGLVARVQTGLLRTYALAIASSVAVLAIVFVAVR